MAIPGKRDFGADLLGNIPPPKFLKREISSTEILALFSSPITLVGAVSGIAHFIDYVSVSRAPGTAYTLNGSTLLRFQINGTTYAQFSTTTVFAGTTLARLIAVNPAFQTYAISGSGSDNTNNPILLNNDVANLTVGTGNLMVEMIYRSWPLSYI